MSTVYENIISLCQERGIKGGKMCVDLGLSRSLMSKLKAAPNCEISSNTARRIANYFGVSTDRVICGKEYIKKEPTLPKEDEFNVDARAMLEQLTALDTDTLKLFVALANAILALKEK